MPILDYNERAIAQIRTLNPARHTDTCLSNSVDAFLNDEDHPGCACKEAVDLDAAEFNDPREQERLQHEADLRYEYSKPEYHEET